MSENYQPPFTMNEEITNLIVEIGEYVGQYAVCICGNYATASAAYFGEIKG